MTQLKHCFMKYECQFQGWVAGIQVSTWLVLFRKCWKPRCSPSSFACWEGLPWALPAKAGQQLGLISPLCQHKQHRLWPIFLPLTYQCYMGLLACRSRITPHLINSCNTNLQRCFKGIQKSRIVAAICRFHHNRHRRTRNGHTGDSATLFYKHYTSPFI